ncbi:MAG: hypothetical protein OEY89_16060 [Gammaproteobacteria bacterium]|nr:hypothetical protein [Gammaproteobacteria bacterium]
MHTIFSEAIKSKFPWVNLVHEYVDYFGLTQVCGAEMIKDVHRTGFTWSEMPFTLCLATNKQYITQALNNTRISALITHSRFSQELEHYPDKLIIFCDQPHELFYAIHNTGIHKLFINTKSQPSLIASTATIAPSAIIHDDVVIGERVSIHDGVIILPGSVIGDDSQIHPGATIGTVGFFSKSIFGKKTQIEHFGGVSIGKNCIVHARSNISRSANHAETTIISDSVHIGIGANIAHDCVVGEGADISARAVLAGRVSVGRNCWIGAGALISNALTIGDGAEIKIGAVVVSDVTPKAVISGNFATNHKKQLKTFLSKI